jgi:hypothetical protein
MKRILSCPINRAFRLTSDLQDYYLLTNIRTRPNELSAKVIKTPDPAPDCGILVWFIFKRFFNVVHKLVKLKSNADCGNFSFSSRFPLWMRLMSRVVPLPRYLISRILIFGYKSKNYDELIAGFDQVCIFTFCYDSEVFLYSSAVRMGKSLNFHIDGVDDYYRWFIPAFCDSYQSWGRLTTSMLSRSGLGPRAWEVDYPGRLYKGAPLKKYIVIHEAAAVRVSKNEHSKMLINFAAAANFLGYKVLFKMLYKYSLFSSSEVIDLGVVPFESSSNASDHGEEYTGFDDLQEIIPNCALLVVFGASHATLEYGVNGVKSLLVMDGGARNYVSEFFRERDIYMVPMTDLTDYQCVVRHIDGALNSKFKLDQVINIGISTSA